VLLILILDERLQKFKCLTTKPAQAGFVVPEGSRADLEDNTSRPIIADLLINGYDE